jgi:hypothetical protein
MPTPKVLLDKAKRTNAAAAAAIEDERLARETKTARLRELRHAKEAADKNPSKDQPQALAKPLA